MIGLTVDLFAGGGGASTGFEAALGRPIDIATIHNGVPVITLAADLTLTTGDAFIEVSPAQYLFLRPDGDLELWKLTTHGWFDATGAHYDSPLKRNPALTQWRRAVL